MSTRRTSRPTLRDVATRVGLHESTVSRILNGQAEAGRIPPETERRVKLIAQRLGYRGNTVARALRTGRMLIVGMVVPDIANLYQARITRGAEDVLAGDGYSLLLASTDNNATRALHQVRAMINVPTDGILYGVARLSDPILSEVLESGTPVVLFNRSVDDHRVSAVLPDDRAGTDIAVRHLVELGHRTIIHVAGPADVSSGIVRKAAFEDTLRHLGLRGESEQACRHTEEEGRRAAEVLLDRVPDATAIVAANDRLALGAIDAARARGLDCPADVSVVGFNDMPYAARFSPSLTTVRIPQYELGRRAARLLVEAMHEPDRRPTTEVLAPELVVRGSTAPRSDTR